MKKNLRISALLIFSWFFIHSLIVTIDGLVDNPEKADCIVILGNKVNPDRTLSPRLQARVEKGLQLYREGYASKILTSGGLGAEGQYEGSVMSDYLVARGVPAKDIFVDDLGVNTYSTAVNFNRIAEGNDFHSVILVSQFFHITRTKCMVKKYGYTVCSAHADYFEVRDLYSLTREFFAFYKYLLLGAE